jgi:hypothetical protein
MKTKDWLLLASVAAAVYWVFRPVPEGTVTVGEVETETPYLLGYSPEEMAAGVPW